MFNEKESYAHQWCLPWLGNRSKQENLVDLIAKALETDVSLDFLLELETPELEILAACVRARIGQAAS